MSEEVAGGTAGCQFVGGGGSGGGGRGVSSIIQIFWPSFYWPPSLQVQPSKYLLLCFLLLRSRSSVNGDVGLWSFDLSALLACDATFTLLAASCAVFIFFGVCHLK